jgi:hypothetical protein
MVLLPLSGEGQEGIMIRWASRLSRFKTLTQKHFGSPKAFMGSQQFECDDAE